MLPYMRWLMLFSGHRESRLVEFTKAGHGTDMFTAEWGLEPLIAEWFVKTLRDTSKPRVIEAGKPDPMVEFWSVLIGPGGAAQATQVFREARSRNPNVVLFPALAPLTLGNELLRSGNVEEAIRVYQLGVLGYPDSALTASGLAGAYDKAGNREKAIEYAERTLQLLEKDAALGQEVRDLLRQREQERLRRLRQQGSVAAPGWGSMGGNRMVETAVYERGNPRAAFDGVDIVLEAGLW